MVAEAMKCSRASRSRCWLLSFLRRVARGGQDGDGTPV